MEMKKVLEQEGRDAKNLLVLQFCVEDALNTKHKSNKKPPTAPKSPLLMLGPKKLTEQHKNGTSGPRIRSASTGRDKKSELQARYWALLFGNLQRAINEIYQTVECYENMSACQETILVLENYIRDFKALAEWFRVSWNYELTPQRPQSLAWEVRKSNPAPRVRARSLTSPNMSGKSSPCYSGKSSPCPPNDQAKNVMSPRKSLKSMDCVQKGATRVNIRELFCSKSSKKPSDTTKPEELNSKEGDLSNNTNPADTHQQVQQPEENTILDNQNLKCEQYSQTDLEDENLTLAEIREKLRQQELNEQPDVEPQSECEISCREPTAVELTVQKLNSMEDDLLIKQSHKPPASLLESEIKKIDPIVQKAKPSVSNLSKSTTEQVPFVTLIPSTVPVTLPPIKKSQSSPMKYSSVLNRPAANRIVGVAKVQSNRAGKPVCSVQALRPASSSSTSFNAPVNPRNTSKASSSGCVKTQPSLNSRQLPQVAPLVRNSSNLVRSDKYVISNVANRLSARSRTMIEMNDRNSRNTSRQPLTANLKKSSREDVGSSSSTLKASNEKINGSRVNISESIKTTKNCDSKQNTNETNNDGWLTVKTRRRSSLHWANRFNQPTGYTSLPTLALLNEKEEATTKTKTTVDNTESKTIETNKKSETQSKKEERMKTTRPEIKNARAKVNSLPLKSVPKSAPNGHVLKPIVKSNSIPSTALNSNSLPVSTNGLTPASRQNNIKRQKSDLTGLKITSLHKEYMRSEKFNKVLSSRNGSEPKENKKKVSVVLKDEIGAPDTNGTDDLELNKNDIKIQTNREFSKTIGDLFESISNAGYNNVLSSCEECEERDDLESDEDQRKLLEEQESLERQIFELQNTEIDVDTETDETDCEVMIDQDDYHEETLVDGASNECMVFVDDENMSLEMRYQALLSGMSWGEREEALATLQAYVSRHPGRAQELHQKLSNPSRRRSLQETLKKYQAKQARAQQKRELLQKDKAQKIQQLLIRVEYVKAAKQQLIDERRLKMEERLQKATEKRNNYLRQIVEKAHDEEKKLKEINFIKNIEAQNKRLDLIESSKETEGRLQDIETERQKRVEEKAAKEAAVERRRQELEQERQKRLEKMNEYRLEREERIGKMQEQREKKRREIAREKARDREERLLALQVQQQQTTEELQRKILQKQMESARRHEENMEQIRQRALELTIPTRTVDETEQRLDSEDGHMSATLSDIGRDHTNTKGFKKKMKKLKNRMAQRSEEYTKELTPLSVHTKRDSEVPKFLNTISKGGGPHGLERPLGQLLRTLAKAQVNDFQCFWILDGLGILSDVITKGMEPNSSISKKAVVLAAQLYRNACSLCPQIARHSILGNSIVTLLDAVLKSLQLPEEKSPHHPVELSTELMLASTVALSPSNTTKHLHTLVLERLPDLTSYAVSIGLIEALSRRCLGIKESVETQQSVVLSLLTTLGLLTEFVKICPTGPTDPTKFLSVAKSTEFFGTISMLYACVLPIGEYIQPRTVSLAASTFSLFTSIAVLNYAMFQEILSPELLSLRLLDVVIILFNYFHSINPTDQKNKEIQGLVIDMVRFLGFFCANNKINQNLLTKEHHSCIIKSIAKLPEEFSVLVYPCLVTITHNNEEARQVVARDFNVELLDEYSRSEKSKQNTMMALLK